MRETALPRSTDGTLAPFRQAGHAGGITIAAVLVLIRLLPAAVSLSEFRAEFSPG